MTTGGIDYLEFPINPAINGNWSGWAKALFVGVKSEIRLIKSR